MRTPFHISKTAGRIALKFGMRLDTQQTARRFTAVNDGVHVHVRTCTRPFCISGMNGRIALKFGVWLGDH